jgi:LPS sulfotransferase NodH
MRPGNVMMFHAGRSGSTVLGDLLGQHPRVFWDSEIFQTSSERWLSRQMRQDPGRSRKAMDHLRDHMRLAGRRFYGVETKLIHLKWVGLGPEEYLDAIRRLGFSHYVILERRNRLRALVSGLVGRTTGTWHSTEQTGDSPARTRIRIDLEKVGIKNGLQTLPEFFDRQQATFAALRRGLEGKPLLSLVYEDDIQKDPTAAYGRVTRFLGLDPAPVKVNLRRTNPFPLSELVENFDKVKAALRGTPYAWMADEPEGSP